MNEKVSPDSDSETDADAVASETLLLADLFFFLRRTNLRRSFLALLAGDVLAALPVAKPPVGCSKVPVVSTAMAQVPADLTKIMSFSCAATMSLLS